MQPNTPAANSSYDSSTAQEIDSLVDTVTDALADTDADSALIDAVEEQGKQVAETADAEIEGLRDQVEDSGEELQDHRDHVGKQTAELNQRVSAVEDEVDEIPDELGQVDVEEANADARNQGSTVENHPTTELQTSLERVVDLDEEIIREELTANQRRARHVATDPKHYGEKTGRGWMLKSSDVSKVLRSGTDCDGRTQTVSRVMDFLGRLGGDEVEVTTHRGTRRVYFSEEVADRLTQLVTADNADNGVVMTGAEGAVI